VSAVARERVVAVLDKRGKFFTAEPFFERGRRWVVDRPKGRGGVRAGVGDLVLLRTGRAGRGRAEVVERLGRPDVARDVLRALLLDRGHAGAFDPAVERAARKPAGEDGTRRDLRDLVTFTIDPTTAKDFDDALSAERLGDDAWRIWVHIADVSAYVAPGSPVDREAARRATSVYVPSLVEPMLPEALSNQSCSLVPGEDRLAVTVEMELRGAEVASVRFSRSLIRSDKRLDYEEVDRIFAGREGAAAPWGEPLEAAREAAAALGAARARRGALVVESNEPDFDFDEEGNVTAARTSEQTESHRLIEHLMIAANEQVAQRLEQQGTPSLFRVHERPEPAAVERLVAQLASLDVPTPPIPSPLHPQQAEEAVGEISVLVDQEVRRRGHGRDAFTALVLRSLKQAHYDPRPLGHAGLRSRHYCHFTSPIRRYPDLICHRALLSTIGAGEHAPDRGGMPDAGVWCSTREREAMMVERRADDVAHCFLLERALFEGGWDRVWEGEVTGVIGAGAFVAFGDGYRGLLPVRRMRGDWWELNEEGTILHGSRTGGTIRLGDPVRVEVDRVETARGRVDLLPVEL
jgi:ribonuclease R